MIVGSDSLYTYALIKTVYDETNSFLLCFSPFILNTIKNDRYYNSRELKKLIHEKYSFEMPLHVINSILLELRRKNFLERKGNLYRLPSNSSNSVLSRQDIKSINRKINYLCDDIIQYFKQKDVAVDGKEVLNMIYNYLSDNVYQVIEMINAEEDFEINVDILDIKYQILIEYILDVDKNKPDNYAILVDLIYGSIISVLLYTKNKSEMDDIIKRSFKNVEIYLDTNFIFFLLGFAHEKNSEPAKELYNALKKYDFRLCVFSFTVDEICRVMNGYAAEHHKYVKGINVDSIYSTLKNKGWTSSDSKRFIKNIEDILSKYDLRIKNIDIGNIEYYETLRPELVNLLNKYKSWQIKKSRNHDLAAIDRITAIRGKVVRNICNSKALFLSSDWALSTFNYNEYGHKEDGTISEVILDRHLSKILWLKNPQIDLSLNTIVSLYSNKLFINRYVWEKFYEQMMKLRIEETISDEDVTMLLHDEGINHNLKYVERTDMDFIDDVYILNKLKTAQEKEEELKKGLKDELSVNFKEEYDKKLSEMEMQNNQKWLDKIQNYKKVKQKEAEEVSNIVSIMVSVIIIGGFFYTLFSLYPILQPVIVKNIPSDLIAPLLSLILSASVLFTISKYLRVKIKKRVYGWLYQNKIKDMAELIN